MNSRKMSVSGQFYPDNKVEIEEYINHFHKLLEDNKFNLDCDFTPRAIISPHAGYVYSGFTVNIAYEIVKQKINPKRIVVIGPSHKFGFDGASISLFDSYETPLGSLDIDLDYANSLYEKFNFFDFIEDGHSEHSTETQMPFIKHYFPDVSVVEIVYSKTNSEDMSEIIAEVLNDEENFVVISTDLSHFHNLEKATYLDKICLEAIVSLDIEKFNKGCEACGLIGVQALVKYANKNSTKVKFCDYRTSADVSNDKNSVVGYTSFVFGV